MKSVLISIQPKWCELIASGKKKIEVRKTAPKDKEPFKVYIYQTKKKWIYKLLKKLGLWQCKVIGEFVCDKVYQYTTGLIKDFDTISNEEIEKESCLTHTELKQYEMSGSDNAVFTRWGLFGWHISDLKIYDKPKELGEFRVYCEKKSCLKCKRSERKSYSFECGQLDKPPQSWFYIEQ